MIPAKVAPASRRLRAKEAKKVLMERVLKVMMTITRVKMALENRMEQTSSLVKAIPKINKLEASSHLKAMITINRRSKWTMRAVISMNKLWRMRLQIKR